MYCSLLRSWTIPFAQVYFYFVRIHCAYGPLSSPKVIVSWISLERSLWKSLKVIFMVQGAVNLFHGPYLCMKGPRYQVRWMPVFCHSKKANGRPFYVVICFLIMCLCMKHFDSMCALSIWYIRTLCMRSCQITNKLFYSHIFQKSSRMHTQCVPGPSPRTRGPGDEPKFFCEPQWNLGGYLQTELQLTN